MFKPGKTKRLQSYVIITPFIDEIWRKKEHYFASWTFLSITIDVPLSLTIFSSFGKL